jgi:hypothetical protein
MDNGKRTEFSSDSQSGAVLLTRGHLGMETLLVVPTEGGWWYWQKPGMLLNDLQGTGHPHTKNYPTMKVSRTGLRNSGLVQGQTMLWERRTI